MVHPDKAVQRSQLPSGRVPAVLCQRSEQSTNEALAAAYGPLEVSEDLQAQRDPESYNDADFYQELLKDLLAANSSLGSGMADLKQVRLCDSMLSHV